jgi:hypothetical protein
MMVHDVVSHLPTDLVTLAHQGKAYSNSFELVYRREASRPNAIWQADHTPLDIELVQSAPLLCDRQFGAKRIPAGRFAGFRKSCIQITAAILLPGIWSRSRRTSRSGSFSQHQVFRVAEGASSVFFHRLIRCFCAHFPASNLQEVRNDSP